MTLFTANWGDPSAAKRALLLHGITGSSLSWYHIARKIASRGYFVTAPDILGHGNARRGSDYTIAALAEEILPLLKTAEGDDHPYHIVVGHSLGGVIVATLLSALKATRPVKVFLIDPPLELTPELRAFSQKLPNEETVVLSTPEAYLEQSPILTKEGALFKFVGKRLCDSDAVSGIVTQNRSWSFSHHLSSPPDNVKVTVLTADPSKSPCMRAEALSPYPNVTIRTAWGASHLIPVEAPQTLIDTVFEGAESVN